MAGAYSPPETKGVSMPIPKPSDKETQDKFMQRCMSSDVMKSEFPKNDQRVAVCMQQWKDKDKKKESSEEKEELFPQPHA